MDDEKWLPISGFEDLYEVSDLGRVKALPRLVTRTELVGPRAGRTYSRLTRERILKPSMNGGHVQVTLCRANDRVTRLVHHLVLETFVGPRPPGLECCHANDVGTDNRLSNLRWDTQSANTLDRVRNGRHNNGSKTHCKYGHKFTPENTTIDGGNGQRRCRTCRRLRAAADRRKVDGRG